MRHVGFRTSTAAREVPAAGRGMTGGGFSLAEDIDGIVQRPCNGPRKARSMGATKDRCAAVIVAVLLMAACGSQPPPPTTSTETRRERSGASRRWPGRCRDPARSSTVGGTA